MTLKSVHDTAEKIKTMEIRGAGLIARTAVQALLDYSDSISTDELAEYKEKLEFAADLLVSTRPTAVSLPNAIKIVINPLKNAKNLDEARKSFRTICTGFIKSSESAVAHIGEIGARYIKDGDVIMTHCNSQVALSCLLTAKSQGRNFEVFATEVRPRNQGHITIKTLNDAGIKTNFIVDSAARYFMKEVDLCIVGSDAITINGAVVNKIGTSQIAHSAHEARVSFMVAAETYKFAPRTILGEKIKIEERDPSEVLDSEKARELPNVRIRNPAFDVTPAEYVDLIITEVGAFPPELAYIIIREQLGWNMDELCFKS